jgi:predicted esterase
VPEHLAPGAKVPLLVLLHGLGETNDERTGAYAWLDRYGLGTSYERLLRPPVERTAKRGEWTDARLAEVNATLDKRPFRGMVVACPYMPQLPAGKLDPYGAWIVDTVVSRARREASMASETVLFGGCSLGGYASLEIFVRRPGDFDAWCGVQTAISEATASSYAERIERALKKAGPRPLYVGSSIGDPFLPGNKALSDWLKRKNIEHELRISPGPHDQPWLREVGTPEMLLWCDGARRDG